MHRANFQKVKNIKYFSDQRLPKQFIHVLIFQLKKPTGNIHSLFQNKL